MEDLYKYLSLIMIANDLNMIDLKTLRPNPNTSIRELMSGPRIEIEVRDGKIIKNEIMTI